MKARPKGSITLRLADGGGVKKWTSVRFSLTISLPLLFYRYKQHAAIHFSSGFIWKLGVLKGSFQEFAKTT